MRVEEEQLVSGARRADGAANRVPPVPLLGDRLRNTVAFVGPAVRVPVGVPPDVEDRSVELIRAALADGRNLQSAARPYSAE